MPWFATHMATLQYKRQTLNTRGALRSQAGSAASEESTRCNSAETTSFGTLPLPARVSLPTPPTPPPTSPSCPPRPRFRNAAQINQSINQPTNQPINQPINQSINHTFPALWLGVSKEIVYFCPPSLSILSHPCPRWQDPQGIQILSEIINPALHRPAPATLLFNAAEEDCGPNPNNKTPDRKIKTKFHLVLGGQADEAGPPHRQGQQAYGSWQDASCPQGLHARAKGLWSLHGY